MSKSSKKNAPLGLAVKEKYIDNLSNYSKVQLLEIRDRQSKLLENKGRLQKLTDKGARIQSLLDRIVKEIESRNEIDLAAAIFSDLNIAEKGLRTLTQMEWNGGEANVVDHRAIVDSDDDDNADPLKSIAQSCSHTKIVKIEKPKESLITAIDLKEIESFADEQQQLEPHALYVCDKDKITNDSPEAKTKKFLPYKTTKSDVHNVEKEKCRETGKHWEVTAATPPIIRNSEAKLLTLKESIDIERKYKHGLKEMQEKQAFERLTMRQKIISDNIALLPIGTDITDPNKLFQTYREIGVADDHSDDNSFSGNSDNAEESEVGGVPVITYDG